MWEERGTMEERGELVKKRRREAGSPGPAGILLLDSEGWVRLTEDSTANSSVEFMFADSFTSAVSGSSTPSASTNAVLKTKETEGGVGGVERIVVTVEERALFASQVAEGFEPLPYSSVFLPLSLWIDDDINPPSPAEHAAREHDPFLLTRQLRLKHSFVEEKKQGDFPTKIEK
ncbi:hypothetical protein INR49_011738 [Caranx melampygus]|nr:hypothetical protein INR49_011738 [Caranx melampygus]